MLKNEVQSFQGVHQFEGHLDTAIHSDKFRTNKIIIIKQNIIHGRNNITYSTDCKCRTAATLYTLETWFFQVYNCNDPAYKW